MTIGIGIDLGTTYSCVMHRTPDGTFDVIESRDGRPLTPSAVYFAPDGTALVGERAKEHLADDHENLVIGIKRQMGRDFPLEYFGNEYTPEGISGLILRGLSEDAGAHLSAESRDLAAVITVPAYFGVGEREATFTSARIAGLTCLELLPEPVAAAYAYGLADEPDRTSLVYDLGGGTFDVAVVGMYEGTPRVWAVDGDTQLGGLDWDRRVEDLLWQQLAQQDDADDLRYDDDVVGKVTSAAEILKRRLTTQSHVTERVFLTGRTLELRVSRAEFEAASTDLLLRSAETARRVMRSATDLGSPDIDQVLLVGGSTRMPMVRSLLEEQLTLPVRIADPDKAVARGAALLADELVTRSAAPASNASRFAEPRITSVLPRSLGVLTWSSADPVRDEPYVQHVLRANTPLPIVEAEHVVATIVDDQDRARIQIYEQAGTRESSAPADNRLLLEGEILGIPPGPAGSPIRLRLSASVDGRISVESMDGARPLRLEIEAFLHGVLDDEEVAAQRTAVAGLKVM
jgi:molecular chaperone DnaK